MEEKTIESPVPVVPARAMMEIPPKAMARRGLMPVTVEESLRLAEILAKSNLVPGPYQGNPSNCFLAIEFGRELGIGWAAAIQNSYVLDGRPKLFGNIILGICRTSSVWEWIKEDYDATTKMATCTVKRRDDPAPVVRSYTYQMAVTAGLVGKDNWKKNEIRMLQMRARNWALGDCFADWLNGVDIGDDEVTIVDSVPPGTMSVPQSADLMPASTDDKPKGEATAVEIKSPQAKKMVAEAEKEKPAPAPAPEPTPPAFARSVAAPISEIQRQELFKLLMKHKVTKDGWTTYLKVVGVRTTQELPATIFEDAKKWIEKFEPPKKT